jgi:hypothetical protein
VQVELKYQTIGYRWAKNLASCKAPEPERFVRYYDSMARDSAAVLGRASVVVQ